MGVVLHPLVDRMKDSAVANAGSSIRENNSLIPLCIAVLVNVIDYAFGYGFGRLVPSRAGCRRVVDSKSPVRTAAFCPITSRSRNRSRSTVSRSTKQGFLQWSARKAYFVKSFVIARSRRLFHRTFVSNWGLKG
ncbi:hypothetical protein VN12_00720 [Pirellula sp. SH-Sr6A]|nr:hypothetical protein VN12_00720 [Pirellula sp. SH-Sr6A]